MRHPFRRHLAGIALLVLVLGLVAGCANLGLRVRARRAVFTAPTCPTTLSPWCTTEEETGTVYYAGPPFVGGGEKANPFCRCARPRR